MAYEKKTSAKQSAAAGTATQGAGHSRGYGAAAQTTPGKTSAQVLGRLRSPMSSNGSGEALSRTLKAMQEVLAKETGTEVSMFKLLPVDALANGLNISSILMHCKNDATGIISCFTFLVEASVGVLRPRIEKTPEGVFEVPVVAADLYGETLLDVNFDILARELSCNVVDIIDAGCQLLPRELAYDDEISFRNVIYSASSAVYSVFVDEEEDPEVLDLTEFGDQVQFIGSMDFRPGILNSSVGLPYRRDVTVSVMTQDQIGTNSVDQTFANSHMLSNASAYVNVVFTGKLPPQQANVYGAPIVQPTQMFTPKLEIVDTATLQGVTPELQMLALASLTKLSSGMHVQAWTNVYNPVVGGAGDMHDISCLAIEMDMPRINTDAADWNPQEFCNMYVDRDLVYVLHVEDAGDLSWFHKIIKQAAINSNAPQRLEALSYIYDSIDNLTGRRVWRDMWKADAPIAEIEDDLIFIGYYIDREGKRRDLREIDYMYALKNFGETDMSLVEQFGYTFVPASGPLFMRLARRKTLMEVMLQQSIVIKSYATPVILYPDWLHAMQAAIAAVGGEPKFEQHLIGQHIQQREHTTLRGHAMRGIAPAPVQYNYGTGQAAYYAPRHR